MKHHQHGVGTTGGAAIGIGLTLFALITFPPLGVVVGAVVAAIGINHFAQRRHRRRIAADQRGRIGRFYAEVEQREISQQWTNPGWRP